MPAIYMSQLSAALPALMEQGDHRQDHHHQGHFVQAFTLPKDSPLLFPFMIGTSDSSLSYGSPDHHQLMRQQQAMLETQHMIGGSAAASVFATPFATVESIRDDMIEPSSYDPYNMGKLQDGRSVLEAATGGNWKLPAKMSITRKASADPGAGVAAVKKPRRSRAQAYEDISSQPNLGVIRVCSDCNTTKTPLWRSGPCGPKSLCNACGIRQRKARRAMMVAAAVSADNGVKAGTATTLSNAMAVHPKVKKGKRADVDRSLPFKKRCKVVQDHAAVAVPADKAGVQQATIAEVSDDACLSRDHNVGNIGLISWSRPSPAPAAAATACSSFRRPSTPALPVQHDEITDAAMLLMTLSCGLVRS